MNRPGATRPAFTDLDSARACIAGTQARLASAGIAWRRPPPEPTTCCGRGCNGCVWEGFYEAVHTWLAEAEAATAA